MSKQSQFACIAVGLILHLLNDTRDRELRSYLEWEAKLREDVKKRGIRNALLVMPEEDKFRLLAGQTRLRVAIQLGLPEVPVRILDGPLTEGDKLREQGLENIMRQQMTDLEIAEMCAAIQAAEGGTQEAIAESFGLGSSRVSRILSFRAQLPQDLLPLIGKGKGLIGPSLAYYLSRMESHEVMREYAKKIINGEIGRYALEKAVSKKGKRQKREKAIKLPVGPGYVIVPGNSIWDTFRQIGAKLQALATRGEKSGGTPEEALPLLLKTI